ncbi:hypothetical protein AAGV37_28745, partial [Pseudomonas protegens]
MLLFFKQGLCTTGLAQNFRQQCPVRQAVGTGSEQVNLCGKAAKRPPGGLGRREDRSEEAQRVDVVAHQQVLGLLVVVEH